MGGRPPQDVKVLSNTARTVLGFALAILIPLLVSLIVAGLWAQYNFPFLFLYLPALLFVSYLAGFLPGIAGAVVSTLLADYLFVGPPGLTLQDAREDAFPSVIFLLSGIIIAGAGDQYRRYQAQLRRDLARSQRRVRDDEFLLQITDLVARQDRGRVHDLVCRRLHDAIGEPCALVISDPQTGRARIGGSSPTADTDRATAASHEILTFQEDPLVRHILQSTQAMVVTRGDRSLEDVLRDSRTARELFGRGGIAALLATPLHFGADTFGYLAVLSTQPRTWSPDDIRLVQATADRLAIAAHRERLERQRTRRERDARFIDGIMVDFAERRDLGETLDSVAKRCTEVLGDWCGIQLIDAEDASLQVGALYHRNATRLSQIRNVLETTPPSKDNALIAQILRSPGPLALYPDDPELGGLIKQVPAFAELFSRLDVKGGLAMPIRHGEETLGIFTVGADEHRQWDEGDLRLLGLMADRTALAIQNGRLRDSERLARRDAEREARRTQAVNRIIAISSKALDLGEVFDEFAEALQLLIPYVWVTITLTETGRDVLVTPYVKGPAANLSTPIEAPRAGTAPGWVLEHRRPLLRHDALEEQEFREDRQAGASGVRSYVIVPMTIAGEVIGTLNFGHHEPGFYKEEHARLVQPIADQLAAAISRFRLFEEVRKRAGELSEMFQRALLPADMPKAPFLALAAHYRPADPEANIGGDWYDAALLPDDRVLISIGDVAGHGISAAAVTGQIRNVIRAYALEERAPSQILSAANRFLSMLADSPHLSVWVGIVDPFDGKLVYAGAGHPPPYLVFHGEAEALTVGGAILGVASMTEHPNAEAMLPPGSRLLAYTDGLIEGTRDVLEGEQRLRAAALATAGDSPERAVQLVLERATQGTRLQDDVALIVVDVLPVTAPLFFSVPAKPENLRRVRRALRAFAERGGAGERVEEIVMAVGEAALNVVEHAYAGHQGNLTVHGERHGGELIVTVQDFGHWRAPVERGRGRGTSIMQGFADSVKTQTGATGTTVELRWAITPRPAVR